MHRENENRTCPKPPEIQEPCSGVVVDLAQKPSGQRTASKGFRSGHRLRNRVDPGLSQGPLTDSAVLGSPETEKLIAFCISELIALLRYANFVPYPAVERWSRRIREIDIRRPRQGLAVLDDLVGDYWSVFSAARPDITGEPHGSDASEFETEMKKLKTGFDMLGAVLMAAEPLKD